MFETPIKNIDNKELLKHCIFMDIPGLNEYESNYIDEIFSIINLKYILFEIFIFDSSSFQSDANLNIFKGLEEKKSLKKEGNLIILNKIDTLSLDGNNTVENVIQKFRDSFYQNYEKNKNDVETENFNLIESEKHSEIIEDEKNNNINIKMNLYANKFIPMNSILYNAEKKYEKDFLSWLIIQLYSWIKNSGGKSFDEYLEKIKENIISQDELNEDDVENSIEDDKIKNYIDKLERIFKQTQKTDLSFGIDKEDEDTITLFKELYSLHKNEKFGLIFHSQYYNDLSEFIKNYKISEEEKSKNIQLENKKEENINKDDFNLKLLNEFFQKESFKDFMELKSNLLAINQMQIYKKIRICFLGQINTGKSTVLNCIIGKKILPISDTECTYRGVIIKHDPNLDDFYLYKVKTVIINPGGGLKEFVNYEEETYHYIKGAKNIEYYLTTKNNDSQINNDSEAFIIIKGKLKIFDYIKLDDELINKIEFVDLPGYDREENIFNKNHFYNKMLKFANSCVYINIAKNIEDKNSVERMKLQYNEDKSYIFVTLRDKFIHTCLFLINKADELSTEVDENIAKNNLNNNIEKIEPLVEKKKATANICLFSGKYFLEYLENYEIFVINMENAPFLTLDYLYNEWSKQFDYIFGYSDFKKFIEKKCKDIKSTFKLRKIDKNKNYVNNGFIANLTQAVYDLSIKKNIIIPEKDEKEIINKLQNIYLLFKSKDFDETKYSGKSFFDNLQKVIINAKNLQKENFYYTFKSFLEAADDLFKRKIEKSNENYKLFNEEIIPSIERLLDDKEQEFKNIINSGKENCKKKIDYNIGNAGEILKHFEYNINLALEQLNDEIKEIYKEMSVNIKIISDNIIEDIKKKAEETIKSHYNSDKLSINEITINIEKTFQLFDKIFGYSINSIFKFFDDLGLAKGILFGNSTITIILVCFLPVTLLGLVVSGILCLIPIVRNFYKKQNYIFELNKYKEYCSDKFENIKYSFNDNYNTFKDSLINELKLKTEVNLKGIFNDENSWKQLKEEYEEIMKKLLKKN